jgi:S-adenosylmethionine hydrolase
MLQNLAAFGSHSPMLITLTTDFGTSSPYVAAMKGSLLTVCQRVTLIDVTHAISPQNVRQAAVVLSDVTPVFPPGTLHVAVIDPGVGTERRIIYAEIGEQRYLAPDNGVLSYLVRHATPGVIVELTESRFWRNAVSDTFHGRDIFAPVAGHLAAGVLPEHLGRVTNQMVCLEWPEPQFQNDEVQAEVLYIDSFGNAITNLSIDSLRRWLGEATLLISIPGREISGLQSTYGNRAAGELMALGDSQGRLELAIVKGNAATTLNVQPGEPIQIRRQNPAPQQS